jgi:hypothetical protein
MQIRGFQAETDDLAAKEMLRTSVSAFRPHRMGLGSRVVAKFQRRIRSGLAQRRLVRLVEFDSWLRDCKVKRFLLALITNVFVITLGLFVMFVCVLLSATFTSDHAVEWYKVVLQSIAVQVR